MPYVNIAVYERKPVENKGRVAHLRPSQNDRVPGSAFGTWESTNLNRRVSAPRRIQPRMRRVRYDRPEMAHTPRLYLDACALNRLTDDPCQPRIAMEAAAMIHILRMVRTGRVNWIASSVLKLELKRNPNALRRDYSLELLRQAAEIRSVNQEVANRARVLNSIGYGKFDAYHLALAEFAKTDILLTTDDRFVRQAHRGLGTPTVLLQNPLDYLQEVKP